MASVPYPTFQTSPTNTPETQSLSAVGRARIHPLTCPGSSTSSQDTTYQQILEKCILQSQTPETPKESAKERKKYMKQSVALASSYLSNTLGLDVSVVDVEIVLPIQDIIDSDGCVASGFLDAGCAYIVIELEKNDLEKALEAMEITRLPRERLVFHLPSVEGFDKVTSDGGGMGIANKAATLSIYCASAPESCQDIVSKLSNVWSNGEKDKKVKLVIQLDKQQQSSAEETAQVVGRIAKSIGENKGYVSLIDPSAEELGLSYAACMKTDREDGLYTTVVCTRSGEALGLVYSSKESIVAALQSGRGVYYSRSRSSLWRKGDTSGHYQTLHRLDVDCDGDALRFTVTQRGDDIRAFCHLNTLTCWGEPRGLRHLEDTLRERLRDAPAGSYTKRLFEDEVLLRDKLVEEAQELSEAEGKQHVAEELADVLYFAMVRAAKAGVSIDDAVMELDKRARKVTRRKGDSKAFRIQAGEEILGKSKGGES